ncbi:MAG: peptidoglycan DD-metalloendopeptidase family protein [Bacilli bacterium]|nr:peptidoglycan DD-metalloendopeptidase family protein [Bacilli bacterium]
MKKYISAFIIIALIITLPSSSTVRATTLGDLKKELAELEASYQAKEEQQQLTQQQINDTYAAIDETNRQINEIDTERTKLTEEIKQLNIEIASKEEEIKQIINFVQVSSGESAYLEYAFGAQSFTDFIYRVSVSEQLTTHNDELINEYNDLIDQNNQKKIELNEKEIALNTNQLELNKKLQSLGNSLNDVLDLKVSVEDEIKMQQEAIKTYESMGCSDDEDIKTCGLKYLPEATEFYRPIVNGYLTSEFGNRCFVLNGSWYCDFHYGVDLSTSEYHTNVYAAAPGVVAGIVYHGSCGGNQIFINHKIGNDTYTTHYAHLYSVNVKVGDVVTTNTVIGIMGGIPSETTWDACSTGQHLHFSISKGLYMKDYYSWTTFISNQLNPRNYVNLPSGLYNSFSGRTIEY